MIDDNPAVGDLLEGSSSRQAPWRIGFTLTVVAAAFALSACDKLSHVGQQTDPPPTASAATVGQPFTKDSSGNLQTTVRAGADVVLTGTNSEKGSANNGLPIIQFTWTQQSSDSVQVDLVQRDSDTVSFTAPQVSTETKLNFQLTVADADGNKASTNAVVTVEPARDADHFLQYLNVSDKFTVTAVTSALVPATAGAAAESTLGFTVTVQEMVSFMDINGNAQMVSVGTPKTYTSGWSAPLGSGGSSCVDARNPQLQIPIPKLNLDDKLSDGSARLSDLLEFSDIDRDPAVSTIPGAVVYAKITIQSAALPSGTSAGVCVNGTAVAAPVTMTSDSLLQTPSSASSPSDNSASAHAYYATIDPEGAANPAAAKSTLTAWLTANHFDPSVSGWGADANAVYTNGFDLGLGRDMYMKVGTCDDGYAALPLQQRIGHCDVASVVVNYGGVQAAANRINPILAVAMEYSATTTSAGKRFVKFYVFAPDTRTGALQRVTSVDLDHRGQKSVPQSCVVCHGGVPGTVTTTAGKSTYSNGGDVGAGWLSWDLDSFYYSDTDPGFSQKSQDAALKAKYTRANQEAQFKLLNSATYLTLDDPNRFALEKELIEGWYGGAGLPNSTFNGTTYVPAGWQPGGTNNNPAGSDKIYRDVFAHNCRMCHVLQVPQGDIDPRTAVGVDAQNNPVSACSSQATTPLVATHQLPMGCFWEFAHTQNLAARLTNGGMPFARRTTDRLWVQPDGSPSAGIELQQYLASLTPPITIVAPGKSVAVISTPAAYQAAADTTSVVTPDIGNAVRLDATSSAFADSLTWSVSACSGTSSVPGQCQRSLPVVGSGSTIGWLLLDDAVTYQLNLSLDGGAGQGAATQYFTVPVTPPILVVNPTLVVQLGTTQSVSPYPTTWITGWGNGGQANNTVLLTLQPGAQLAIAPASCATAPGCSGTVAGAGIQVTSTGNSGATTNYTMTLTVTGQGTNPAEAQSQPINVTVQNNLVAPPLTLPAVVFANATSSTPFNLATALTQSSATFPNCTSVSISSTTYTGPYGSTGTYDSGTDVLTYIPGPHFATYTHAGTVPPQPPAPDTFQYTLQCTLQNTLVETATGTITVPVLANNSISDAQAVWVNNGCDSCHGQGGAAPDFGHQLNALKTGDLSYYLSLVPQVIKPYVDPANAARSGLLCWPEENGICSNDSTTLEPFHMGGQISPTVLAPVLQWIEDGANSF